MSIIIKSFIDIKKIRIVSRIVSEVLFYISKYIKPGVSTGEIDFICNKRIIDYHKAFPACLGYMDYPKSICTSVNDVVCHGIPNFDQILKKGDIINIDVAIVKNKYYSDASKMYFVGKPSQLSFDLCRITYNSVIKALKYIGPGKKLNIIGKIIQDYVEKNGYSVVRNYCGHGIGKKLHEEPQVLHYYSNINDNIILKSGMIFTIEPMVNVGSYKTKVMDDGWTVKTVDGGLSAQYEFTVLITDYGYEILTF